MDTDKFASFIAERRRELGLTQQELAEKLNVTDKAVSRWENGHGFPDVNTLEPLADSLGISIVELMKSEMICEDTISSETADTALSDTIEMASIETKRKNIFTVIIVLAVFIAAVVITFFAWQLWAYNNPAVLLGYGIPTPKFYVNGEWRGAGLVESLHYENGKMVIDKFADCVWKYYRNGEWLDIEPGMENWYSGVIDTMHSRSIFGISKTWQLRSTELALANNEFMDTVLGARNKKPYLFLSRAEVINGHTLYTYIGYYTENGVTMPYYQTFNFNFEVNGTIENISEDNFEMIWEKFPELKEAYESRTPSGIWNAEHHPYYQNNLNESDWVSFTFEYDSPVIWYPD